MAGNKTGLYGMSHLMRVLRRIPEDTKDDLRENIRFAADRILREARRRVTPMSKNTASALRVVITRKGMTARVGIIGQRARKKAFVYRWLEFGTAPHSLKAGARLANKKYSKKAKTGTGNNGLHPGQNATPFLFPAYHATKNANIKMIRASIDRTLRRAAKK